MGQGFEFRVYFKCVLSIHQPPFVGSNRAVSNRQINAALQQAPKAKITITANQRDEGIEVSWRISPVHKGDVLNLALVQNRTRRQVTAGENTGRALTHVNVVRDLQTVRVDDASGRVTFALPQDYTATEYHLVAYVQCSDLRVLAATRSEIAIQGERNSLPECSLGRRLRISLLRNHCGGTIRDRR